MGIDVQSVKIGFYGFLFLQQFLKSNPSDVGLVIGRLAGRVSGVMIVVIGKEALTLSK